MMKIPEPVLKPVGLKTFLNDICTLSGNVESASACEITSVVTPPELTMKMDRELMEQVLINPA